ncbi:MAG: 16S rRNA (adenine(1518)-N(6)/adenine(1519)-N(6))-dimethyltransferase RsmA [Pseudomonadaceae bacterium]|nr:16S rRNA (adenine(1518)-N(6)/adenine(1519)-N(6))-dimethyltransferase RsmA [Pseudomonadaceae bacterium]
MRARKRFGQNFLIDDSVSQRIVDSLSLQPADQVIEIGPGHGALTALIAEEVPAFTAVELDRDLIPFLRARFAELDVISADVLKLDFVELFDAGCVRLLGNLPYNISSPVLLKLLPVAGQLRDATFMLQREMAQRLVAEPGSKAWGRLGVQIQYAFAVDWLFEVPPEAFDPQPKVTSAVVRLRPRVPDTEVVDYSLFNRLLTLAFNARRKTLRNGLKSLAIDFSCLDASEDQRPDTTTLAQFVELANWCHDNPA